MQHRLSEGCNDKVLFFTQGSEGTRLHLRVAFIIYEHKKSFHREQSQSLVQRFD